MIETYCDACGARLEGVHESDVMVYFKYTPGGLVDTLLDDGWHVIERGSRYIFAFRENDYALFTWRKEY